ncbi:MAG: ribonuclease III [Ruminococcaceae bacterium]|nr:ribonuclease III [Oscillospiraceae bacterium]
MCLNENSISESNLFFSKALTKAEAKQYSPLTLAFLGDAVYSLLVREMLLKTANRPTNTLHKESIKLVNANCQAEMIKKVLSELTEEEEAIFKRGRNAHSGHVPKNQSDADYRYATGLETLYGYLYLIGDFKRIMYIFNISTGEEYLEKQSEKK